MKRGNDKMKKALHTKSIFKSNLATDIRIAKKYGFGALEIVASKLASFLEEGFTTADLDKMLKDNELKAVCINDICGVESPRPEALERMLAEAHYFSSVAQDIGCPVIQLVPLLELEGRPFDEIIEITANNIRKIADIGATYGVGFQLEPVAWSPIHSLSKALKLIEKVDRDNVRMVIDTWHLWAGGETTPDDVAKLDQSMIYNIHFCDGKKQSRDTVWDETKLRGYYYGKGDIPLKEFAKAIKATGYDGWWSCELVSSKHWECDVFDVAERLSKDMDEYIFHVK
ncbi:sugar phosphate isomerase/epimerase family protein [Crassaminicella profunda]|uniref:sugar phosphate isomerase/epimerase family protein n=1 Tax=Crassaminicella profunda TaxID=1286698 RepID=UPI001CA6CF49|nr:sugar phosphate isomerase/epimerase family protein [Crassaminicella profunda]QZY53608.1 sugar phosphate isomerase/epimerase [Crassaminicella profunda]